MISIRDYNLTPQLQKSTPIHIFYKGHPKNCSKKHYDVESIYLNYVPSTYQTLLAQATQKIFDQPAILLKEIFLNPQNKKEYVFVEQQNQLIPLELIMNELNAEFQLGERLMWVLTLAKLVPFILKNGLLHDFSPSKIACSTDRPNPGIYLKEFTKFTINMKENSLQNLDSKIIQNMNIIIRSLIGNQIKDFDQITFSQTSDISSKVRLYNKQFSIEGDCSTIKIDLNFYNKRVNIKYVSTFQESNGSKQIVQEKSRVLLNDQLELFVSALITHNLQDFFKEQPQNVTLMNPLSNNLELKQEYQDKPAESENVQPVKDSENRAYPYNLIGKIASTMTYLSNKKQSFGTGVLISKNLVVTCAHNLIIKPRGQKIIWQVDSPKDIQFVLGGIHYEVESFRKPEKYHPSPDIQALLNVKPQQDIQKYDYALLKLKQDIPMKFYIDIVKDYERMQVGISLKGNQKVAGRQTDRQTQTRIMESKKFYFTEKRICFRTDPRANDDPKVGFSGGPLFIVASRINQEAAYYFMIGVYYGKQTSTFLGNNFNNQNLIDFARWQKEMTGTQKVFKQILSFKTVVNMSADLRKCYKSISEIEFNKDELKYYPEMFKKLDFQKMLTGNTVQRLYFDVAGIERKKMTGIEYNRLMKNLGSRTELERHNNLAFMYHLRNYEEWHIEFYTFPGHKQGFMLITNYIARRLYFFFKQARAKKGGEKSLANFLIRYQKAVKTIYNRQNFPSVPKARRLWQSCLSQIEQMLKIVPLNERFKALIIFQKDCALVTSERLQINHKSLYDLPTLLAYVFVAKLWVVKLAELDVALKNYLGLLKQMIVICLQMLGNHSETQMKETMHSFLWGVKEMLSNYTLFESETVKKTVLAMIEGSSYRSFRGGDQMQVIRTYYFTQRVWSFLKFYKELQYIEEQQSEDQLN